MVSKPQDAQPSRGRTMPLLLAAIAALSVLFTAWITPSAHAEVWSGGGSIAGIDSGTTAGGFKVFLKKGESVYLSSSSKITRVVDQDGNAQTLGAQSGATYGPASADGVWNVGVGGATFTIEARSATGTAIPGRVWSDGVKLSQSASNAGTRDLKFWIVNDTGYVYELGLDDFNGIASDITATALGVPRDCLPTYASGGSSITAPASCGVPNFRLFLDKPAADLPATANEAGSEIYVVPPVLTEPDMSASTITYAAASPGTTAMAGTFTMTMNERFYGGYTLEIDVDGDGAFDGARDVAIPRFARGEATSTYTWDGKDAEGNTTAFEGTKFNARLKFDRLGEVHVTLNDVEGRGGISIIRLNGEGAPDDTIYWNDGATNQELEGTPSNVAGGYNGAHGVHGWRFGGSNTSGYGNGRHIDDWTYMPSEAVTALLPFGGLPKLTITSAVADVTEFKEGQSVNYTFTVTNDGTEPLKDVTVASDAFTGSGAAPAITCTPTNLAPGEAATCRATYTTTDADFNADSVVNSVSAAAVTTNGEAPVKSDQATVTVEPVSQPSLTLTVKPTPELVAAGQEITYEFEVENTGNEAIDSIAIDPLTFAGSGPKPVVSCPTDPLPPGETATCTATYTATQADAARGSIDITASAQGQTVADDAPVASNPVVNSVDVEKPRLTVTTTNPPAFTEGVPTTFTFSVKNDGNVPLDDLAIDPGSSFNGSGTLGAITCTETTLAAGAETTCTATYTPTAADVANGYLSVTGTGSASTPSDAAVASGPATATTLADGYTPAVTTTITANKTVITAGDPIEYTYTIENTGTVNLEAVNLVPGPFTGSSALGTPACSPEVSPADPLIPGANVTCTVTYTPTPQDEARGSLGNQVSATGTDSTSATVSSPPAAITTPAADPKLAIESVDHPASFYAGQEVSLTYTVHNTGNVPLTGVTIANDIFTGDGDAPTVVCDPEDLGLGGVTTCTVRYTATEADVAAGKIGSAAHATGTSPSSARVASKPLEAAVPTQEPSLTILSAVQDRDGFHEGEEIAYTYTVKNDGNTPIENLTITPENFTGSGTFPTVTCEATTLAAGAETTCRATYTATAEDVGRGSIVADVQATGTAESSGTPVASPTAGTTAAAEAASLALTVTPDKTEFSAGDVITYTYQVTNTGNVTVDGVTIDTSSFSGSGTPPTVVCAETSVEPGEVITCTATYTATEADVARGSVATEAMAAGAIHGSDTQVASNSASAFVPATPVPAAPALTVDVEADKTTFVAGEDITYTFTVTNTGDTPLSELTLPLDEFTGSGPAPTIVCEETSLAVGATVTCTAVYTATPDDVAAGSIDLTAHGQAIPDGSEEPITSEPDTITVPAAVPGSPALAVDVEADKTTFVAGEDITYTFTVTNTGDTPLSELTLPLDEFTGSGPAPTIVCEETTLAVGATVTCTAVYTATPDDVAAGSIDLTAHGQAIPEGSEEPITSEPDTITVPVAVSGLSLVVTPDRASFRAGDIITYSFAVTNTGNVPLDALGIEITGFSGTGAKPVIVCPTTSVGVGETVTCYAKYAATSADAEAGQLDLDAVATAVGPAGALASNTSGGTVDPITGAVTSPETENTLPETGHLASTGASVAGAISLALLLALGGAVLIIARRRASRSGEAGDE